MKRVWLPVLAVVALVVVVMLRQAQHEGADGKPVVKIGTLFPLTGNMAHVGKTLQGAVEVAVNDANKNPDNRYFYEVVSEDSMLNMAKSAAIASKMISLDKVDAMISFAADIGNAVVPVAEKSKVIHFAMSVDPSGASGEYNFINWTMPDSSTDKMVEIIKEKGFENVAIVSFNQSGALANSNMLKAKLDREGIVNNLYKFNPDIRDFRMDIEKMNEAGACLYVLRMFEPQMSVFIKQLRELGIEAEVTSVELFGLVEDKSVIKGHWYVDVANENFDKLREIKSYNGSDTDYALGMAYDDVMLIVKAFEAADDKEGAVEALAWIEIFHGIAGVLIQDENGIFDSEASFRIVE